MSEDKSRRKIKPKSNLFKIGKTWYLRYRIKTPDGKSKLVRASLHTTSKTEAEEKKKEMLLSSKDLKTAQDVIHKVARAKKIYQPKIFPVASIEPKFEKHLQRKGSSEDSINRYKLRINQFIKWLESNHAEITNLSNVTDAIAKEYADWLGTTRLASKTHNDVLNALSLIFETFRDETNILKNPFKKENTPRKELISVSRKEFTEEEAKKILDSFSLIKIIHKKELEVLFYLGMFAGLRLKDAVLLKWGKIDFKANRIAVTPEKTKRYGTFVNIPLHPALREKLQSALPWLTNDFVLPQLVERYNQSRDSVVRLVSQVLKLNGFDSKDMEDTKLIRSRSASIYGFHSLRYSFACFCARAGIPIGLVQEIIGHKSPVMTQFYTRYDNNFRQKAIQSFQITLPTSEQETLRDTVLNRLKTATEEQLQYIHDYLGAL